MPLIWNDDVTKFVDDTVEFDQSQFVIVRKVFIRFKEHAQNKDEQWIRRAFKQIDEIESVEIFEEENNYSWAYVTYVDSNDVYRAVRDAPQLDEIEIALPADTWVQPSSLSYAEPSAETLVAALNELDPTVYSDRGPPDEHLTLRDLIFMSARSQEPSVKEALCRIVPRLYSYDFQLSNAKGTAMLLSEFRTVLQCIGRDITELSVTFRQDKYPKHVDRYYQKMCQYVGPQLTKLTLAGLSPNQEWLVALKPLLGQIEDLSLEMKNYDIDYDIDFEKYCPNVKTLTLLMNLHGKHLSKRQPQLERLIMLQNQYMVKQLVFEFIENNPQLLTLKIQAQDTDNLLSHIPLHLPNLEYLCLHQGFPNITADNLEKLTVLRHLKSLELMYLNQDDVNGILNFMPKLRQLEALKIHLFNDSPDPKQLQDIFKPNPDLLITLAQELPLLRLFHLRFCQIDIETFYTIIRTARRLLILTLNGCGLEITDTVLEGIQSIRIANNLPPMMIYADKIHPELNRETAYSTVTLIPFNIYKSKPLRP